jgi:hypothetical protein
MTQQIDLSNFEVKDRYEELKQKRSSLENIWKQCAELTLPYLFPDDSYQEGTELKTPYNSIGAFGVNNLSAKLLLALFPPTTTFFRLMPKEELKNAEELSEEQKNAIEAELLKLEKEVQEEITRQAIRTPLYEALKLTVALGNACVYKVPNKGGIKVFSPKEYVVSRDFQGNLYELIIKEKININLLPDEIKAQVETQNTGNTDDNLDDEYEIYTYSRRVGDTYYTIQEVEGIRFNQISFDKDKFPYLVLRWSYTIGDDYGKGLVEQYLGDLRSLEGLTQIIVESAGVSAKTIFGLRPSATTSIDDLTNAKNGEVIVGDLEKDVSVLRVQKGMDYQVPFNLLQSLEQRLSKAFMLVTDSIRDAERVTAQEVRIVTNEIETTLGGVFSIFSQELQRPLLILVLNEIDNTALNVSDPVIITGLTALSREREFQQLVTFLQTIVGLGGDVVAQYLKVDGFLQQVAISLGIDPKDVVKTQQEILQEQQQQLLLQQQLIQQQEGIPVAPENIIPQ